MVRFSGPKLPPGIAFGLIMGGTSFLYFAAKFPLGTLLMSFARWHHISSRRSNSCMIIPYDIASKPPPPPYFVGMYVGLMHLSCQVLFIICFGKWLCSLFSIVGIMAVFTQLRIVSRMSFVPRSIDYLIANNQILDK